MSSSISRAVMGSSPAVGSSYKMISGFVITARASPTRFFMPPLSSEGILSIASSSPTRRSCSTTSSLIFSSDVFVCLRSGNSRFSRTDIES